MKKVLTIIISAILISMALSSCENSNQNSNTTSDEKATEQAPGDDVQKLAKLAKSEASVIESAIKKCQNDIISETDTTYNGHTKYINADDEIKTVPNIKSAYAAITVEDVAGINAINDRFISISCNNIEYNPYWVLGSESCVFLSKDGENIDKSQKYSNDDIIKLNSKNTPDSNINIYTLKMTSIDNIKNPAVENASKITQAIIQCKESIKSGNTEIYNGTSTYIDSLGNNRVVPSATEENGYITVGDVAGINDLNEAFKTVSFGGFAYNPYWDADTEKCVFLNDNKNNIETLPVVTEYKSNNLIKLNLNDRPDDSLRIDSLRKGVKVNQTAINDAKAIQDAINECKSHISSKKSDKYDGSTTYTTAFGTTNVVPSIENHIIITMEDVAGINNINNSFRDIIDEGISYSPYWDKVNNKCLFLDNKGNDINTKAVYENFTNCVKISSGNAPDKNVKIDDLE